MLYYFSSMLKVTFGLRNVPSATRSPKLQLILVKSNDFLFLCKYSLLPEYVKDYMATNVSFSEIFHEFCLRFSMVPNFFPPQRMVIS